MAKWEYCILKFKPMEGCDDLNIAGKNGWELTSVTSNWAERHQICYLKRLLPAEAGE